MIKTQMNSGIFPPEIMLGFGTTEMSYIMKQLENAISIHDATNSLMTSRCTEHCPMGTRFLLCKDKVLRPNHKWTNGNKTKVSNTQFNQEPTERALLMTLTDMQE